MRYQQTSVQQKRQQRLTAPRRVRRGASSSQPRIDNQEGHAHRQRKVFPCEHKPLVPLYGSLFSCGFLVPAQFFTPPQQSHLFWRGEQRLLFAVLQDAVACWFRYRDTLIRRGHRLFGETVAWFESSDTSWLYAFERICGILGLDPEYIRRGLRDWRSTVSVPPTLSNGVRRRATAKRTHWLA